MRDKKLFDVFGVLYPPALYLMIMMTVQSIGVIVLTSSHIDELKKYRSVNAEQAHNFIDDVNGLVNKYGYIFSLISAVIAIFVFIYIYRKDEVKKNSVTLNQQILEIKKENVNKILVICAMAIAINLGLSRFLSLLPLDNIIGNYEETQGVLLSGNILFQILTVGIVIPFAEELIYRGIVLNRLKIVVGKELAIVISASIFGIFHLNLMQGIYAFLFGVVLAVFATEYNNFLYAVIIHVCANVTAVITTKLGFVKFINNHIFLYLTVMVIEITVASFIIYKLFSKKNVNTN